MSLYVKRRKRFLKKILVGTSLFIAGIAAYLAFFWLSASFLPDGFLSHPAFPLLVMTFVSLAVYKPLDVLVTQFFKNYLFKKRSYSHMTLMDLAEELSVVLDLAELGNLVVNTFGEVLHLKTVSLLLGTWRRGPPNRPDGPR